MPGKLTIAFPHINGRYYFNLPSTSFENKIDYKMWGGGGASSNLGGNGAGGNFLAGTTTVPSDALVELFIGGAASGRSPGVSYNYNQYRFAGGVGGYFSDNDGGHGGGGGGSTVIVANSNITACAGGGGGGAGYGDDYWAPYPLTATGDPNYSASYASYAAGATHSAWSSLLNTYSTWEGNGDYYWQVNFPEDGTYNFQASIDDYGTMFIDGQSVVSIGGYSSVYSGSVFVSAGIHQVRIYAINTGGPGSLGARILHPNGSVIWTSRSPRYTTSSGRGADGANGWDDGYGGGGGGGAGYPGGGIGGGASQPGGNGQNYNGVEEAPGQYGNYTTPGGVNDPDYPGGSVGYANGGQGYAILTFYRRDGLYIKNDSMYKAMMPHVKIGGTYRRVETWIKMGGVWVPSFSTDDINYATDSTHWG